VSIAKIIFRKDEEELKNWQYILVLVIIMLIFSAIVGALEGINER
jgi:hypothetical protein